ncbi:porin PorA family protein [Streptomyces sioyaensis]|uniref:porin PorA family protein n=1 Tax=Streptomyces sioyaensis TaxID=67364 RepID=UPI00379CC83C
MVVAGARPFPAVGAAGGHRAARRRLRRGRSGRGGPAGAGAGPRPGAPLVGQRQGTGRVWTSGCRRVSHSEQRSGLQTYVFQATEPAARITDSQVLAGLPKALPQSELKLLVQFGPLTPDQQQKLTALLPSLSDPAPLSYTLQGNDTFWVEPETGSVIDVKRVQQRTAALTGPDGTLIPLLPVIDASYQQTSAAVSSAVNDAKNGRDTISLVGTTLPIIAGILGALLIAAALLVPGRHRAAEPTTGPTPEPPAGPTPGPSTEPSAGSEPPQGTGS